MKENMSRFLGVIVQHLSKDELKPEEKIKFIVTTYIDLLQQNPDLPFFILNEMQSSSKKAKNIFADESNHLAMIRLKFVKQLEEIMKKGKIGNIHPLHIVSNLIGLTIFPFIARGILADQLAKISDKQFAELMEERKK